MSRRFISLTLIAVLAFWTCESTILRSIQTINPAKSSKFCKNCVCGIKWESRIVNGDVTSFEEFPWAVQIKFNGRHHCGGSMITQRHILTAAHCIHKFRWWHLSIHLGDTFTYRIKSLKVHEKYDQVTMINDIGIIELYLPVSLNASVKTSCLPSSPTFNYTGMTAVAIGWGRTEEGEPVSEQLRKVDLPIMSKEECLQSAYPKYRITDNIICAGYIEGGRDSCDGDSGGPLLVRNDVGAMELVGVVSLGKGCARPNYPGIYTNVINYLQWILTRVDNECFCLLPKQNR